MPSASSRPRSARGQGAAVREELLSVAELLLQERGRAESITVAEIVKRVGVTAPILYSHFADKDALFVAVHLRRLEDFRDTLRRATRKAGNPTEALQLRGRAYIRYATSKRDAYIALFMTASSLSVDVFTDPVARSLTAFDDLVENVRECQRASKHRASHDVTEDDAELAARVVWCQVHGLASLLITMPEIANGIGRQRLIDSCLNAITASLDAVQSQS